MENELLEWKKIVFEARGKYYELNYFTMTQLLSLRQKLGAMNASSEGALVPSNILVLLQSISSEVTSEFVCGVVKGVVGGNIEHEEPVACELERTLDSPFLVSSPKDNVEVEKPTLTEDELTPEQKKIMIYVVQRLQCPKLLVLKAFEENRGKDMNRYDFKEWCGKNQAKYNYEDEDGYQSDDDSLSQQSYDETFQFTHLLASSCKCPYILMRKLGFIIISYCSSGIY
jgi:hypothetical protein